MEEWQVAFVDSSKELLVNVTEVGVLLIAKLRAVGVLSDDDAAYLEAASNRGNAARLLYELLVTRKGAFECLAKCLLDTGQTDAVALIKQAYVDQKQDLPDFQKLCFKQQDIKPNTTWSDLSNALKSTILNKEVLYQGKRVALKDYCCVDTNVYSLVQLAKTDEPEIVRNEIPMELPYCVLRTLTRKDRFNLQVLKDLSDVFLIEGVEKSELDALVGETAQPSGTQLNNLTSNLILLEAPDHYATISNATSTVVHWMVYEHNALKLVRSSNSPRNLEKHRSKIRSYYNEDEVAKFKVVLITASPGMGKTALLHHIGRTLVSQNILVRYIVMNTIVQALNNITTDSVVNWIAEQSSDYEHGRNLVTQKLKTQDCVLMFDAFDEVPSRQVKKATEVLDAVGKLNSARIFVATRKHTTEALENALHTISFSIEGINEPNQVDLLLGYWENENIDVNEHVREFAKSRVELLQSATDFELHNIAAIPLQCKLIAEISKDAASRISNIGFDKYDKADSIKSIFDLYETHMKMRFENICVNEGLIKRVFKRILSKPDTYEAVKKTHMHYALNLLFRLKTDEFSLLDDSISTKFLCGLGVLEASNKTIEFVHRTFAEYLVAWFVVEHHQQVNASSHFIFSRVFSTESSSVSLTPFGRNMSDGNYEETSYSVCNPISKFTIAMLGTPYFSGYLPAKLYKFDLPVVCYFINEFTKRDTRSVKPSISRIIDSPDEYDKVAEIFIASAYHNYPFIPFAAAQYMSEMGEEPPSQKHNVHELLFITAMFADLELYKTYAEKREIEHIELKFPPAYYHGSKYSKTFNLTPLHVGLNKGKYKLVEYLLGKYTKKLIELTYLLHFCLHKSAMLSDSLVEDKKQMIKLLVKAHNQWADERLPNDVAPILLPNSHPDLFVCLVEQGACVNAHDSYQNTPLHVLTTTITEPEKYHAMLLYLNEQGFKGFAHRNRQHVTPLHVAVSRIELHANSLQFFQSKGADFNASDESGDSVLFYAVQTRRSMKLIKGLITLGADWNVSNKNRQTILHVCAMASHYEACKYFVQSYPLDVNAKDKNHNTPLHHAVAVYNPEAIIDLLIANGADVHAENQNHDTPLSKAITLVRTKEFSSKIINLIETHTPVTQREASSALNKLIRRQNYSASNQWMEYLIRKGGAIDFEFTNNIWKWEFMQQNMSDIIEHTCVDSNLLQDAEQYGLLTQLEVCEISGCPSNSEKVNRFYNLLKEKPGSFELAYLMFSGTESELEYILSRVMAKAAKKLRHSVFVKPIAGLELEDRTVELLTKHGATASEQVRETTTAGLVEQPNKKALESLDAEMYEFLTNSLLQANSEPVENPKSTAHLVVGLDAACISEEFILPNKQLLNQPFEQKAPTDYGVKPEKSSIEIIKTEELSRIKEYLSDFPIEWVNRLAEFFIAAFEFREYAVGEHLLRVLKISPTNTEACLKTILIDSIKTFRNSKPELISDKMRLVNYLIKLNPGLVAFTDQNNCTALHVSTLMVHSQQLQLIQILLKHGSIVNARDNFNLTPLHYAVRQSPAPEKAPEIVGLLIQHGADVSAVDLEGRNFIHLAAFTLPPDVFHELLRHLVKLEKTEIIASVTSVGSNALHFSLYADNEPLQNTLEIFKAHGLDFNAINTHGNSIILLALKSGRSGSFISSLIELGTDWRISVQGKNVLHLASEYANISALQFFLPFSSDIDTKCNAGLTPLHYAIGSRHEKQAKVMPMQHNPDVNARSEPTLDIKVQHRDRDCKTFD